MATAVKTVPSVEYIPGDRLHRLTVEQYHRMIEAGILTDDDRVELIHGWILNKMPQNPPHVLAITRVNRRLVRLLPDEWLLQLQSAITLRESEPEPDFASISGPEQDSVDRKPMARDVAPVIEVADSTLRQSRQEKAQLYAQARIPEYWIVNLVNSRLEVYKRPRGGRSPAYRQQRNYGTDEVVKLQLEGDEIARIPV